MYELKDNYSMSGTSIKTLKSLLEEVEHQTKYRNVRSDTIELLVYKSLPPAQEKEALRFWRLNESTLKNLSFGTCQLQTVAIPTKTIPTPLAEDIRKVGLMMNTGSGLFLLSQFALPTLLARGDLKGERIMRNTMSRNIYLLEGLIKSERECKLVLREQNKIGKVFGCFTPRYAPVPLTIIPRIAEEVLKAGKTMGKGEVKNWIFTQDFVSMNLEFPEAGKEFSEFYDLPEPVIPGVRICSSETGASSLIVQVTQRFSDHKYPIIEKDLRTRHIGTLDPDELVGDMDAQIFSEVRKLPERLGELMDMPACTGDTDPRRIMNLYRAVFDHCKAKKALGSKRLKSLLEQLEAEIDTSLTYSMYDIASTVMNISDRIEAVDSVRQILAESCAAAAYFDFEHADKTIAKKEEEEEVILLPA